jgi:hypothetical protein
MAKGDRYFYFFRGSLQTHVHLYKGWVDVARKQGLPIELITILPLPTYLKQRKLVSKYKIADYFHIICGSIPKIDSLIIFIYFFSIVLTSRKVIIHLRKRSPIPFDFLKRLLGSRLKYIIELEGDYKSEMEYLIEHPYKDSFYRKYIRNMERQIFLLRKKIENADHILVVAPKLKKLLTERYPDLNLTHKISVIPTGVDSEQCFFSGRVRDEYRKKLNLENKFAMIYIGNAYYSWQNVFRTIEIFKLIKSRATENAFLILLIRKQDHYIVEDFIEQLSLSSKEYILTQVGHEEIPKFLNASDIGMLLRHKHLMNEVSAPGKFGEYTACGLPVLMTDGISNFSEELSKTDYGIVLRDMDDDDEIVTKIAPFIKYDKEKRAEISEWARSRFSTYAYSQTYANVLHRMSASDL